MNTSKRNEELLREAASLGDEEGVRSLIENGTNINAQHSLNGWTALHWASKRGYPAIVKYLLTNGADSSLKSLYGESPLAVAKDDNIRELLLESSDLTENKSTVSLPITPNYLANPVLSEKVDLYEYNSSQAEFQKTNMPNKGSIQSTEEELVLKIRTSSPPNQDFIEVEIPLNQLSYENVIKICCEELHVSPQSVTKLRKLPNTTVRKDKDVRRFQDFQELELVIGETFRQQIETDSVSSVKREYNGHVKNDTDINKCHLISKSNYCKNGKILY